MKHDDDDGVSYLDVGDVVDLSPVQHGLHWLNTQNRMLQSAQPGQKPCDNMMTKLVLKYRSAIVFVVDSDLL